MQVISSVLSGVLILKPQVFGDLRGFFLESWNEKAFQRATGLDVHFVQDNHSRSQKGVLRGLHYQLTRPQGKLVRVAAGRVLDVAVDMRKASPTFGQHIAVVLSEQNQQQLWIPPGFAHGFVVLSKTADFLYKTTDYYAPEDERCIRWDDPDLRIDWQFESIPPQLSQKDRAGTSFQQAAPYLYL